jgi:hypothetical protein
MNSVREAVFFCLPAARKLCYIKDIMGQNLSLRNDDALPGTPLVSSLPDTCYSRVVPGVVARAGKAASRRYLEFFTANIRNANTRIAYHHAVNQFFSWCSDFGIELEGVSPMLVAAYIEGLTERVSAPTVKLRLAAIRQLFDFLVVGNVMPSNPAASVRGPKHVVKRGKTRMALSPLSPFVRLSLRRISRANWRGIDTGAPVTHMCHHGFGRLTVR